MHHAKHSFNERLRIPVNPRCLMYMLLCQTLKAESTGDISVYNLVSRSQCLFSHLAVDGEVGSLRK